MYSYYIELFCNWYSFIYVGLIILLFQNNNNYARHPIISFRIHSTRHTYQMKGIWISKKDHNYIYFKMISLVSLTQLVWNPPNDTLRRIIDMNIWNSLHVRSKHLVSKQLSVWATTRHPVIDIETVTSASR